MVLIDFYNERVKCLLFDCFNALLITLQKHAYSNIWKFSPPKIEHFQIKKTLIFFIFLIKT